MRFFFSFSIASCLVFNLSSVPCSAQYEYTAPMNGSLYHDINRDIIIRPGELLRASSIKKSIFKIEGVISGNHDFQLILCDDQKTLLLRPTSSFAYHEKISVSINSQLQDVNGNEIPATSFYFFTQQKFTGEQETEIKTAMNQSQDLPAEEAMIDSTSQSNNFYNILVNKNPAPGQIFFSTFSGLGYTDNRIWIIDNNGDSVFSQRNSNRTYDFKISHIGYITVFDPELRSFVVLDSNFSKVAHFHCQNGYITDDHEFQIFPDHHSFIIGDQFVFMQVYPMDTGWSHGALVTENVFQELDKDGNEIFEWRSVDHMSVNEALHQNLYAGTIDAVHMNALERDADGNILVSFRNLDQIDKIDLKTGNFIWRLGGLKNEFTFINDSQRFTYQHDIRRLLNGDITLFDNGVFHMPSQAFAKEYKLDEIAKTATLVWSYAHPYVNGKPVSSTAEGNVQRLFNGNTFIDWGWIPFNSGFPNITEVDPSGNIVWELQCDPAQWNIIYRAYKFDWKPCSRPSLRKMNATVLNNSSVVLSWNPSSGAQKYLIEYKETGAGEWNDLTVNANQFSTTVNDLLPNIKYEWRMQTWCDSSGINHSDFTEKLYFETGASRMDESIKSNLTFSLYPNPSSRKLFISLASADGDGAAEILDQLGNVMLKQDISDHTTEISLLGLRNGVYFIRITTDQLTCTKSFLKIN